MNIGEFFFISFEGDKVDRAFISFLKKIKPGGIIFFSRNIINPEQIYNLIKNIIEELDYCPFLSIDLEGGKVNRFKNILPPLPSFSDLGKIKSTQIIKKHAELSARAMNVFGFNTNFSPVLDLDFNHQNGLENRTLGSDPNLVIKLAKVYLEIFKEYKLFTTLKHFPGLGRAESDTHFTLPTINVSFLELEQKDLIPFEYLKNLAPFIMVNHAYYSCFESNKLPASLSSAIIQNLLKNKLNYNGIVITDDLTMGAVKDFENASLKAFLAGADIILLCTQPSEIERNFKKFKNEYYKHKISENRLKQSFQRINKIKCLINPPPISFDFRIIDSLIKEFEVHYKQVMKLLN